MLRALVLLSVAAAALAGESIVVEPDLGSGEVLMSMPSGTQTLVPGSRFRQRCTFTSPDLLKDEPILFRKVGSAGVLGGVKMAEGDFMYTIDSVTSEDAGEYQCSLLLDGNNYIASVILEVEEITAPPATQEHKKSFDRFAYQRTCRPGCKGQPGDHGPHGDDGAAGPAGAPGPVGPPGVTMRRPIKIKILKGDDGFQGRPGPAGSPGMHGMHGMPGFPGESGGEGAKGAAGQPGYPGQQGPPGGPGPAGDMGLKGFEGRPGIAGRTGATGDKGTPGLQGVPGPNGDFGDVGEPGLRGLEGVPGNQGLEGAMGAEGGRGDTGDTGTTGDTGVMGLVGDSGFAGAVGIEGETGGIGATGAKGSPGPKGATGEIGPEVYIHERVRKECNAQTFGEVAYGPNMGKLYFCNGDTWECVESGGCKECDEYVTPWTPWSQCSVTCGDGQQKRTRTFAQRPDFALEDCPLEEVRDCSTGIPCEFCVEDGTIYQVGESIYITTPANVAADVLLVVDESSSMETEHAWLPTMVEQLETNLRADGIGTGTRANMYSLTGFGAGSSLPDQCPTAKLTLSSKQRFFPQRLYSEANSHLSTAKNGDREDGYHALVWAIDTTPYRRGPGIGRNIILVTDEDRDNDCGHKFGLNADNVRAKLQSTGFQLNGVYNMQYNVSKGGRSQGMALGMYGATDGDRTAYIQDGRGGYTSVDDVSMTTSTNQPVYNVKTREHYVDWTLGQDGAVWDLSTLRNVGSVQASFTSAFVDIKTREIANKARACSVCTCSLVRGVASSSCRPAPNARECVCLAGDRQFINGVCL